MTLLELDIMHGKGYSVENVMPYMRKPVVDEAIHIIGEAYSDQQGWVEGAFCVAEKCCRTTLV
jgi:monoamine oxidase